MWYSSRHRYNLIGIICACLFVLSWFCDDVMASPSVGNGQRRIALLLKTKENAFYDAIVLGAREQAAKYGLELTLHYGDNEDDWRSQVQLLNEHAADFDGFVLIPNRSDQFGVALKKLHQDGRPVVIIDTPVTDGANFTLTTVSSDNTIGGRLAGLFLVQQISRRPSEYPCVVLFSGNPHSKTHQDRNAGFFEVLKAEIPHIPVHSFDGMSSFHTSRRLARAHMQELIHCGAVFAGSDTMILGVLAAFDDTKKPAPDLIIGYDAIIEVQREILKGHVSASVQQLPAEMGRTAILALHDHFLGQPVKRELTIIPRLSVRRFQLETLSEEDLLKRNRAVVGSVTSRTRE